MKVSFTFLWYIVHSTQYKYNVNFLQLPHQQSLHEKLSVTSNNRKLKQFLGCVDFLHPKKSCFSLGFQILSMSKPCKIQCFNLKCATKKKIQQLKKRFIDIPVVQMPLPQSQQLLSCLTAMVLTTLGQECSLHMPLLRSAHSSQEWFHWSHQGLQQHPQPTRQEPYYYKECIYYFFMQLFSIASLIL